MQVKCCGDNRTTSHIAVVSVYILMGRYLQKSFIIDLLTVIESVNGQLCSPTLINSYLSTTNCLPLESNMDDFIFDIKILISLGFFMLNCLRAFITHFLVWFGLTCEYIQKSFIPCFGIAEYIF